MVRMQEERMKDFEKHQKLEIELVKKKGELEKSDEKNLHLKNDVCNLNKDLEKVSHFHVFY